MRGQRYDTLEDMEQAVCRCLQADGTEFYRKRIFKLAERWEKFVKKWRLLLKSDRIVCRLRRCTWFGLKILRLLKNVAHDIRYDLCI